MEILNQIYEWVINHPYIISGALVTIGAVGAGIFIHRENKDYERRKKEREEKRSHIRAILDSGEFSETEALVGRLYMGKYFGFANPDELYRKVAKEMGIKEEKIEKLERLIKDFSKL